MVKKVTFIGFRGGNRANRPPPGSTPALNPLGQRSLLLPSDAWSQENLQDWIPSPRRLNSTQGQLSNSGVAKGGGGGGGPPLVALLWGQHYGLCCCRL